MLYRQIIGVVCNPVEYRFPDGIMVFERLPEIVRRKENHNGTVLTLCGISVAVLFDAGRHTVSRHDDIPAVLGIDDGHDIHSCHFRRREKGKTENGNQLSRANAYLSVCTSGGVFDCRKLKLLQRI
jgi:hypothetical protein